MSQLIFKSRVEQEMSFGLRSRSFVWCFACGLVLSLSGCDKIPTWGELTGGAKPAPAPVIQTPAAVPVAPVQESKPAEPKAEEIIAQFKSLRSSQINDQSILQLTSLNEGLDQITEINADGSLVTKDAFKSIQKLPNLRQLRLNGSRVDNDACAIFAELSSLEVLALSNTTVSDVGIAAISGMQNLKHLELVGCRIDDNGFAAIGKLPALKTILIESTGLTNERLNLVCNAKTLTYLMISKNSINDYGLLALKKLGELEGLELSHTAVSGAGLAEVLKAGGLKKLTHLGMYACPVNEVGAKAMATLKTLEHLNIGELSQMNDEVLYFIVSKMKKLKYLNLSKCVALNGQGLTGLKGCNDLAELHIDQCPQIGDAVVPFLKTLKGLKIVTVQGNAITPSGILALRNALPEATVN